MKPSNTFDEIVKATGSALIGLGAGFVFLIVADGVCMVCRINFPEIGSVILGLFAILSGSIPGYLNPRYAVLGTAICVGGYMLCNGIYDQLAHMPQPLDHALRLASIVMLAMAAAFVMRTWRLRDLLRKTVAQ